MIEQGQQIVHCSYRQEITDSNRAVKPAHCRQQYDCVQRKIQNRERDQGAEEVDIVSFGQCCCKSVERNFPENKNEDDDRQRRGDEGP